jgi:phosphatidylinositol glycan class B
MEPFSKYRKLIIFGIIIHIFTAIFSVGYYHVDEHFQILEFTSLKLGIAQEEQLPWEFQAHLRPAIQPAFAYILIKILNFAALNNPFYHATILRIISAVLSLYCMYLLIVTLIPEIKADYLKKWFIFLSLMIWFLPYIHVRFSSENWSGIFFWIGFTLLFKINKEEQIQESGYIKFIIAGLIFGLAFILRYQIGLSIAGLFLWLLFIRKEKWSRLSAFGSGIVLFIMIGILIDYWYYSEWTFTIWNYLKVNLLEGKTSDFGIQPWWYYVKEIVVKGVPPFSLVILFSMILVWLKYPKHVLTWILIPYVAIHTFIGHKELRFLFPLVNILPFLIVFSFQIISENQRLSRFNTIFRSTKKPVLLFFMVINFILLFVVCVKPADMHIYLYQYIYNRYDPQRTEIISVGRGPYSRAVPVNFYKKKEFQIKTFDNEQEIYQYILTSDKTILYATKKPILDPILKSLNCREVYQNLPPGVKFYNINNWVERTPFWTLYECKVD